MKIDRALFLVLAAASVAVVAEAAALNHGFTYQGWLVDGGNPANGAYELRSTLFDSETGGSPVGSTLTNGSVAVLDGVFTMHLDFGPGTFDGTAYWLELAVRPDGSGNDFTLLSPRQAITRAPYATHAVLAATADSAAAVSAAGIVGTIDDARLSANIPRLFVANTSVQARATPIITSGFLTGTVLVEGGSGYRTAPLVSVSDTTGSGAVIIAVLSADGVVTNLLVQLAGGGYSANTTLTIEPPPSNDSQVFASRNTFSGANVLTNDGNVFAGRFAGDGAGLVGLNAAALISGTVPDARLGESVTRDAEIVPAVLAGDGAGSGLDADRLDGLESTAFALATHDHGDVFWRLGGNGGTNPADDFLGTTDNQSLELRVNGRRALRLEPTDDVALRSNMVNVIHGASVNFAAPGVHGATISGGGAGNYDGVAYTNSIEANLGTIAGGAGNLIQTFSDGSSIGGGGRNRVLGAYNAAIAGGVDNTIQSGSLNGSIGGGQFNVLESGAYASRIGGGIQNTIEAGAGYAGIGGGTDNSIRPGAMYSIVGGGVGNGIGSPYASVGGGGFNSIGTNSNSGTISGGFGHAIQDNSFDGAIGGGSYALIGMNSAYATVGGGRLNSVGDNATSSTVGGGLQNAIRSGSAFSTVGGGEWNTIRTNATHSTISGGSQNSVGGRYAFAGGRRASADHDGVFAWAGGGTTNYPSTAPGTFNVYTTNGASFDYGGQRGDGRGNRWVYLGTLNPGSTITAWNGAILTDGGVWSNASDRNRKTDFENVDAREVLDRLAALPVHRWRYTNEVAGTRHLGPTAQDFQVAFGLGSDDKSIGTVDADGVALAAIQGLNEKLEAKLREQYLELGRKEARIATLERSLAELRSLVTRLAERPDR